MAKAKRPVSINGIEFDALISEERSLQATIPEYVVEDGFTVSDAVIFSPERLSMTLYVTDTPVTWSKTHGGSGWAELICTRLESAYYKGEPLKIITSDKIYQNMCIETIAFNKSAEEGYARVVPVTFKQIRKTKAEVVTIPSKYGKSGISYGNNGNANTSSSSSSSNSSFGSLGDYDFSSKNEDDFDFDLESLFPGQSSGTTGSVSGGKNDQSSTLYEIFKSMGLV